MKELLYKLAVIGVVTFAVLSALRLVQIDQVFLLGLVPLAPWLFLAASGVLAAFTSRRAFFSVTILVVLAVVLAMPGALPPRSGCTTSPESDTLEATDSNAVIYSHNVLFGAANPESVAEQAISSGAHIIVLQEAVPEFVDRITPFLDDYDHMIQDGQQVLFSKYEVASSQRLLFATPTHGILQASVNTPGGELLVVNVHATPPHVNGGREAQLEQFEYLTELLGDSDGPSVVAIGDFNATFSDVVYRSISSADAVDDAHGVSGCGFAATWSPFPGFGPALLGIDHAVVAGVDVEVFAVHDYVGSDHKGIAVQMSLPG